MRKDRESGAIVVEATISLTAFIFAIFTILSIVNICFIQAKISVALNTAAKEISQYSYLYYALGIDNMESKFQQGTGEGRELANNTIDGIGTVMDSLSDAGSSIESFDFDGLSNAVETGYQSVDSLVSMYGEKIKNDPKGMIAGMGKMALNELGQEAKTLLAQVLAKAFMSKNLRSTDKDNADAFLRRYNVVDGMDGLNFNYTTFLAYGQSDEIQLVVTYKVRVLQLLNINYDFTIRQCCKTTAWDNGISKLEEKNLGISSGENVWDLGSTVRGKKIVAAEKKNYTYTSSGVGYDAYDNTNGKNEFVTITSGDTTLPSYATEKGVRGILLRERNKLLNGADCLPEEIEVTGKDGKDVKLKSNPDSRTYKIVLVVPDSDIDKDYIKQAVKTFQDENPGYTVEIKGGYGNPTPPSAETQPENGGGES